MVAVAESGNFSFEPCGICVSPSGCTFDVRSQGSTVTRQARQRSDQVASGELSMDRAADTMQQTQRELPVHWQEQARQFVVRHGCGFSEETIVELYQNAAAFYEANDIPTTTIEDEG